jgi:hypothetical protein
LSQEAIRNWLRKDSSVLLKPEALGKRRKHTSKCKLEEAFINGRELTPKQGPPALHKGWHRKFCHLHISKTLTANWATTALSGADGEASKASIKTSKSGSSTRKSLDNLENMLYQSSATPGRKKGKSWQGHP